MSNIATILNLINDAVFVSLVNTTLQMTLLIPLIALVIFLFRIKSAATRYSLWLFVIFGIIALPLITPFISQIDFTKFYNQGATGDGLNDLMRLRMGSSGAGELSKNGDSTPSTGATKATVKKEDDVSLINPVSVAYFLWCAGALFMLCVTLDAYRRLRKLRISSSDVKDSVALEMLEQLKRKIGVTRPVALKASKEIYTPVSIGFFSHTIILPDGVTSSVENPPSPPFDKGGKKGISPSLENINPAPPLEKGVGGILTPPLKKGAGGIYDELEMFLTHELAHIKRCDYLINFLQNMLNAIFFFHPLFHFVSRSLTREREHICDDWVIDMTKQRGGYAECIINLLEKALSKPVNVPVAIAMAERKRDIPRRIDMIMDKKRKITAKVSKKALIAMLLIGCLSLPVIGGIGLVHFSGARTASNEGRIVFAREEQGIWVIDADGKNEKQLTAVKYDMYPAWSPDGRLIAFANQGIRICIMNADGTNVKQVTNSNGFDASDWDPTWSPDGKQIAFDRVLWERKDDKVEAKSVDIYVIDADGSNVKSLTDGQLLFLEPDWSPDGKKIAVQEQDRQGARAPQVWVMDADGSNQRMLNDWGENPTWSPDGIKIAFSSGRDGWAAWKTNDIYVMNADGSNVKILTTPGPSSESHPRWSSDGTKIAFVSNRDGNFEIYVMDADGSNVQRLTNTPANERGLDWTAYSYGVESAGKLKSTWGKIKQNLFGK